MRLSQLQIRLYLCNAPQHKEGLLYDGQAIERVMADGGHYHTLPLAQALDWYATARNGFVDAEQLQRHLSDYFSRRPDAP